MVDRVEHQRERVILTRNGHAAAVLISPADLAQRGGSRHFGPPDEGPIVSSTASTTIFWRPPKPPCRSPPRSCRCSAGRMDVTRSGRARPRPRRRCRLSAPFSGPPGSSSRVVRESAG
ncbi:MAG: type II toxin-antitoxin system Phd/YefM family antitoxin [Actinomycetota bacterium]|nr:type II toxin-antitoxin system Phd/YefM family antitoxin [Actinomycetota bacterium]MDQ3708963.1 type II toxin-antitoxin system Phd/YefM family antitoxin [Actinomycetota bacterium]